MRTSIRKKIRAIYSFIRLNFWVKPRNIFVLIKNKELYIAESYYPEKKGNSNWRNFLCQFVQILKYGSPNNYYFSYGFDIKSSKEQDEYVHFRHFFERIMSLNLLERLNCCIILSDKILFNIFANGIGISTPCNVWYSANGKLYDYITRRELFADDIIKSEYDNLFCKFVDGECGNGIFKLRISCGICFINEQEENATIVYDKLVSGRYLVQRVIDQNEALASLHRESINSLRVITVKSVKDGKIRVWPSILRIGTGASVVDNTSKGGLCVGVDTETGRLKRYAFFKPQFGRKCTIHPDSDIVFENYEIPFWDKVKEQAIYFHSMLSGIQSVGWDIAIGENGPIFIEGNHNWEINGPQICHGGLRQLFEEQMFK